MKNKIALTIVALGLSLPAIQLHAQEAGTPPPHGPRGEGHRPTPPLIAALDANHDGVIDEAELNGAPAALRTLDKNADGKLTKDELRPAGPGPKADAANRDHARPARKHDGGPAANKESTPAGGRPHGPPLLGVLDANHDGVIDESEIANATAALKTLDKNSDGKLTRDEIRPGGPGRPKNSDGPKGDHPARKPHAGKSDTTEQ